jgi:hypothetical protein
MTVHQWTFYSSIIEGLHYECLSKSEPKYLANLLEVTLSNWLAVSVVCQFLSMQLVLPADL